MTRRTRTAAIVAVTLVALAVIIWVASGGGNPANQATTGSESAQDRSSPATATATATATSDYAPAPSEDPVTDLPVQLEPVPLDETAQFGDQVSAELVDLVAVEAEGQVPGEISGPALRVTVRLINGTSQPAIGPRCRHRLPVFRARPDPGAADRGRRRGRFPRVVTSGGHCAGQLYVLGRRERAGRHLGHREPLADIHDRGVQRCSELTISPSLRPGASQGCLGP